MPSTRSPDGVDEAPPSSDTVFRCGGVVFIVGPPDNAAITAANFVKEFHGAPLQQLLVREEGGKAILAEARGSHGGGDQLNAQSLPPVSQSSALGKHILRGYSKGGGVPWYTPGGIEPENKPFELDRIRKTEHNDWLRRLGNAVATHAEAVHHGAGYLLQGAPEAGANLSNALGTAFKRTGVHGARALFGKTHASAFLKACTILQPGNAKDRAQVRTAMKAYAQFKHSTMD